MTKFFVERGGRKTPLHKPEDVQSFLAQGKGHWRPGYSAAELAKAWIGCDGVPRAVRTVLDTAPDLRGAALLEGYFEQKTPLGSRGRDSQTDLLAVFDVDGNRLVAGIEGKRDEPFGPRVRDWNDGPGKANRLAGLCGLLELAADQVSDLRYQLLHRTAAALLEAEKRGAANALVLVHSFSLKARSFDAFAAFTERLGAAVTAPGEIGPAVGRHGCRLRFGWVDDPKPLP